MKVVKYIHHLTKEGCYCSILDFYKMIAEKVGYTVTDATRFDCRKIYCTEDVGDEIFKFYKDTTGESAAPLWICCGPKASIVPSNNSDIYIAAVEDGAFYEGEKEND